MILTFFKGFWRELIRLLKDPRGLFMFLIAPIALNLIVCGVFSNGIVKNIRLAAVDGASSAKTRELIRAFEDSDRFTIAAVLPEQEEAKRMLEADEIEGILIIPDGYTRALQLGQQAEVLVGINSANNIVGNSAVVSVMQVVKTISTQIAVKSYVATGSTVAEGTAKVMPISTVLRPWFNPQFSYLIYLGLGLVALIFHQLFMLTVATAFAEEKKEGILTGELPKRDCIIHFFNKMIFYGVTGFLNLWLNYHVVMRLFGFPMRGSKEDMLLLCGYYLFSMLGFGALLGLVCKNTLHAMQWLMALTYPIFILTGFSWPHTEMPAVLVEAAQILPATHFLTPLRNIVLMGMSYDTPSLAHERDMLLLLGAAAFLLSLLLFIGKVFWADKKKAAGEEAVQA